mmetsp:Transcript_94754/g.305888  ORF Transcript_94754/g.305888 Transcript_94754/m.305888 type:complete len:302 (-) Transcript_94754:12-917(-)
MSLHRQGLLWKGLQLLLMLLQPLATPDERRPQLVESILHLSDILHLLLQPMAIHRCRGVPETLAALTVEMDAATDVLGHQSGRFEGEQNVSLILGVNVGPAGPRRRRRGSAGAHRHLRRTLRREVRRAVEPSGMMRNVGCQGSCPIGGGRAQVQKAVMSCTANAVALVASVYWSGHLELPLGDQPLHDLPGTRRHSSWGQNVGEVAGLGEDARIVHCPAAPATKSFSRPLATRPERPVSELRLEARDADEALGRLCHCPSGARVCGQPAKEQDAHCTEPNSALAEGAAMRSKTRGAVVQLV